LQDWTPSFSAGDTCLRAVAPHALPLHRSGSKHLLQNGECARGRSLRQRAEPAKQLLAVHRAELVEDDVPCLVPETTGNPKRVGVRAPGEGRHNEGPEMRVQLVR